MAFSVASAISHFVAASRVDMVVIYWRLEAQGEGGLGEFVRASLTRSQSYLIVVG